MFKLTTLMGTILGIAIAVGSGDVWSRASVSIDSKAGPGRLKTERTPAHAIAGHRIGKMALAVANNGTIGSGFAMAATDVFTGELVPSCEYPKGSDVNYLFAGALWVGAIVGQDTLVSVGADGWRPAREMFPDEWGSAVIEKRSILNGDPGAVSEEDYIFTYTDTLTLGVPNDYFGRPHLPLAIEVTQSSYAWSYVYAEDLVLLKYEIKNIGSQTLSNAYVGFYVDGDVYHEANWTGFRDDVCGMFWSFPFSYHGYQFVDTFKLAWIADNDGDLNGSYKARDVTGTFILSNLPRSAKLSFNWWLSNGNPALDFGPRERPFQGSWAEPFRDFMTGGLGTPEGDVNKYYVMRNQEIDYDQVFTAVVGPNNPLWMNPVSGQVTQGMVYDFANGYDTRYLLSVGPLRLVPGQTLPLTLAYVGGEYFHVFPSNIQNLPFQPEQYYANLNFAGLAYNAKWARWIYDTPGVDTDSDGYRGLLIIDCQAQDCDTIWISGDGVPDFKGAWPPPAPAFWLTAGVHSLHIRWNGLHSETTVDPISGKIDFEGYNVYLAQEDIRSSFALVASYDIDNYYKYTFRYGWGQFELRDDPFTLEELRCLYGSGPDPCHDSSFIPTDYTESAPYVHPLFPDSVFYFAPVGSNPQLGVTTPIRKRYPQAAYPSTLNPSQANPEELTEDGYLKYFEYELTIDELEAEILYYVNVTGFDHGSVFAGVPGLESSVTQGVQSARVRGTPEVGRVLVDVLPGACPNYLNLKPDDVTAQPNTLSGSQPQPIHVGNSDGASVSSLGSLSVAILGGKDFDVMSVDPSTLTLGGVPPLTSGVEDVAAPVPDGAEECACVDAGPDGYLDLAMEFDLDRLLHMIGAVDRGDTVVLSLEGRFRYGLRFAGSDCVIVGSVVSSGAPSQVPLVRLDGNYPNPFNPVTVISFSLAAPTAVTLEVYNVRGQKVTELVNGHLEAGEHSVEWDAGTYASGVYIYRLRAGAVRYSKKMLLVK